MRAQSRGFSALGVHWSVGIPPPAEGAMVRCGASLKKKAPGEHIPYIDANDEKKRKQVCETRGVSCMKTRSDDFPPFPPPDYYLKRRIWFGMYFCVCPYLDRLCKE